MSNTKSQSVRLKEWADTLSPEQLKELVITLTEELIMAETICFYNDTKVPYWDANGDNIDGSERVHEDEED